MYIHWTELLNDNYEKLILHCHLDQNYLLLFDIQKNHWHILNKGIKFEFGRFYHCCCHCENDTPSKTFIAVSKSRIFIFDLNPPFTINDQKNITYYDLKNEHILNDLTTNDLVSNIESILLYKDKIALINELTYNNHVKKLNISIYAQMKNGNNATTRIINLTHELISINYHHKLILNQTQISIKSENKLIFWTLEPFRIFKMAFGDIAMMSQSERVIGIIDNNNLSKINLYVVNELRNIKNKTNDNYYLLTEGESRIIRNPKGHEITMFDAYDHDTKLIIILKSFDIMILSIDTDPLKYLYYINNENYNVHGYCFNGHVISFLKENDSRDVYLDMINEKTGISTHQVKLNNIKWHVSKCTKIHHIESQQFIILEDSKSLTKLNYVENNDNNIAALYFTAEQNLNISSVSFHGTKVAFSYNCKISNVKHYGYFDLTDFSNSKILNLNKYEPMASTPLIFSPDEKHLSFLNATEKGPVLVFINTELNTEITSESMSNISTVSSAEDIKMSIIEHNYIDIGIHVYIVNMVYWSTLHERVIFCNYFSLNNSKQEIVSDIKMPYQAHALNRNNKTLSLLFVDKCAHIEIWDILALKRKDVVIYEHVTHGIYNGCEQVLISNTGKYLVVQDKQGNQPFISYPNSSFESKIDLNSSKKNCYKINNNYKRDTIILTDNEYVFYIDENKDMKMMCLKNNKIETVIKSGNGKMMMSENVSVMVWMRFDGHGIQLLMFNALMMVEKEILDYRIIKLLNGNRIECRDVSHLCDECYVNRCDRDGWNLIMRAIQDENVEIIRYVIDWAIDKNVKLCLVNQCEKVECDNLSNDRSNNNGLKSAIINEQVIFHHF